VLGNTIIVPEMFWVEHLDLGRFMDAIVLKANDLIDTQPDLRELLVDDVITRMQKYQRTRLPYG
jgi:hypothetical protein